MWGYQANKNPGASSWGGTGNSTSGFLSGNPNATHTNVPGAGCPVWLQGIDVASISANTLYEQLPAGLQSKVKEIHGKIQEERDIAESLQHKCADMRSAMHSVQRSLRCLSKGPNSAEALRWNNDNLERGIRALRAEADLLARQVQREAREPWNRISSRVPHNATGRLVPGSHNSENAQSAEASLFFRDVLEDLKPRMAHIENIIHHLNTELVCDLPTETVMSEATTTLLDVSSDFNAYGDGIPGFPRSSNSGNARESFHVTSARPNYPQNREPGMAPQHFGTSVSRSGDVILATLDAQNDLFLQTATLVAHNHEACEEARDYYRRVTGNTGDIFATKKSFGFPQKICDKPKGLSPSSEGFSTNIHQIRVEERRAASPHRLTFTTAPVGSPPSSAGIAGTNPLQGVQSSGWGNTTASFQGPNAAPSFNTGIAPVGAQSISAQGAMGVSSGNGFNGGVNPATGALSNALGFHNVSQNGTTNTSTTTTNNNNNNNSAAIGTSMTTAQNNTVTSYTFGAQAANTGSFQTPMPTANPGSAMIGNNMHQTNTINKKGTNPMSLTASTPWGGGSFVSPSPAVGGGWGSTIKK